MQGRGETSITSGLRRIRRGARGGKMQCRRSSSVVLLLFTVVALYGEGVYGTPSFYSCRAFAHSHLAAGVLQMTVP